MTDWKPWPVYEHYAATLDEPSYDVPSVIHVELRLELGNGDPAAHHWVTVHDLTGSTSVPIFNGPGENDPIQGKITDADGKVDLWIAPGKYQWEMTDQTNAMTTVRVIDVNYPLVICPGCELAKPADQMSDYVCNDCRYG
jgi:hypothetical protein